MSPELLTIDGEIFMDAKVKLNEALNTVVKKLNQKGLTEGSVSLKIRIGLKEAITENGEVFKSPTIVPKISMSIGAKADVKCSTPLGLLMVTDENGDILVGTNQIEMSELAREEA